MESPKCPHCGNHELGKIMLVETLQAERPILGVDDDGLVLGERQDLEKSDDDFLWCRACNTNFLMGQEPE